MGLIIGIDLGTTNSLCAIFRDGRPELIPNAHGNSLTPSVVGLLDDGQVVVGAPAKDLRVTKPGQCASTFKRLMGSDRTIKLGARTFTAPELSSLVLKALKHDAEAHLGQPIEEAVISVPAYFNDQQRKATKLAGKLAGLKVRRIINEPTAAALTYGFHDREAEKKLIVIDLGGGTFDVTLMEIFEGTLEIISTAGESFLGGEDFTDRLVATVLKQQGAVLEVVELKEPLRLARLRQECERAKRKLSSEEVVRVRLPNEQGELSEDQPGIKITRENFAKVCQPLIDRLMRPIGKALRDANVAPEDIDDVILVGGATRMPVLRDFVREYLQAEPLDHINPDEVVALGAAVQAALIADDAAVDDMVMTDVCPFTLGVEVAKDFGSQVQGGYYSPIIHRNTTIPVSKEQIYSTMHAGQREVLLRVYQGEHRKVKDNLLLGELRLTGFEPGPAGQQFYCRFTYDINGILEVEAYHAAGQKVRAVFTQHAGDLTDDEIEAAVQRMQDVKFYPREDIRNQRLLLFCERLAGEVSPFHREELEQALDLFEHAMASSDRELFQHASQALLTLLSSLGYEFDEQDNLEDDA